MEGGMHGRIDGWVVRMNGWMEGQMEGRMDAQDEWMGGRIHGWKNEWVEGRRDDEASEIEKDINREIDQSIDITGCSTRLKRCSINVVECR